MILYENYLVIGAKLLICFIRLLDVIYKIILNAVNDFDFAGGGVFGVPVPGIRRLWNYG